MYSVSWSLTKHAAFAGALDHVVRNNCLVGAIAVIPVGCLLGVPRHCVVGLQPAVGAVPLPLAAGGRAAPAVVVLIP